MMKCFSPQEWEKSHSEQHGLGALNEGLVESFGDTVQLGGVMDIQVMNCPTSLKVSFKLLAYKFPSMVASQACYAPRGYGEL